MGIKTEEVKVVEDVHGSDTATSVHYDHAHGGYKVRVQVSAERLNAPSAWHAPASIRALIRNLEEQAAEAEAANLEMFGSTEGPQ